MEKLLGRPVAEAMCADIKERVVRLSEKGITPGIAIVRVGNKPDDIYYQNSAVKRAESVGINTFSAQLDENVTQAEVEAKVIELNADKNVHGILLLMPLPRHIDSQAVIKCISPEKDADGLTDGNMLKLYKGERGGYAPCTPSAVMELLEYNGIDVCGKNVVIVGRSMVVGKPLSMLMLAKNATVTVCHSKTADLKGVCRQADILVAAVGRAKMITADYIKEGAIVVDVGINEDENGNMCGDVDFESVATVAAALTPVPGGVGGITTCVLAKHVTETAEASVE